MYLEIGSLYVRYAYIYIYSVKCSIIHIIHRYMIYVMREALK